jgi:hypothetical protein
MVTTGFTATLQTTGTADADAMSAVFAIAASKICYASPRLSTQKKTASNALTKQSASRLAKGSALCTAGRLENEIN